MIRFKTLEYKNFLSTGNTPTKIQLDKESATLVVGSNGAGKSTMLDALSFALFGKPHRNINKPQLVNSINGKNCEVEVVFSVGDNEYRVFRSIKPGTFKIFKNDKILNEESHSRDYQKILENNILKMNHKSFHQVVVLGSSSFVPFMQLPASARRNVIEDLLDIGVFTKMNGLAKEKASALKSKIQKTQSDIDLCVESIRLQENHIAQLRQLDITQATKDKKKIEELKDEKELLSKRNQLLNEQYELEKPKIDEKLNELQTKDEKLSKELNDVNYEVKELVKRDKFLNDNYECPTCSQKIDEDFAKHEQTCIRKKSTEIYKRATELKEYKQSISDSIKDIKSQSEKLQNYLYDMRANTMSIQNIEKQIKELKDKNDVDSVDTTKADAELQIAKEKYIKLKESSTQQSNMKAYIDAIFELLKDTGIKTKIIREYLPAMNKMINQYLHILDFFVSFTLDDSFTETIRSRHRDDFSYDSFSEGEKQRIDLALLFSWRQIAKMKNSANTNLLILDETFDSSLDTDGVDNLIKILHTLRSDSNVFVISHKQDLLEGKFPSKLEFQKVRNFSVLSSS
jgi:DNA repair exonuclease SbcCD ATPase subunit